MMAQGERQKMTAILMCIFFTGIILRFFLAAVIPHAGDIDAWMHYSNYWEQGLYSPYNEVDRYKYSPFWFWIISLVSLICKAMGCPFFFAIRVPIIATDVVLFWLLLKCCKQLTFSSNRTLLTMALFFLNPISFQMSGFFGQFDNMSMLFILCAWYACTFQPKWHFGWTLAFINISLAIKHFTIMLVPVLAFAQQKWNRKVSVAIFSPALFFAILIPFWIHDTQWVNISVFQYNLGSGYWGWLGIICRSVLLITHYDIVNQPWFIHTSLINPLLYLAMLLGSFWIVKHYTLLDSLILLLLVFLCINHSNGPPIHCLDSSTCCITPQSVFLCLQHHRRCTAHIILLFSLSLVL